MRSMVYSSFWGNAGLLSSTVSQPMERELLAPQRLPFGMTDWFLVGMEDWAIGTTIGDLKGLS